ncbi:TatD family hydrolase [Thalassotalea atypica]|uniref:TatD family hydrolase n=1 Tax=Thalassotalea atypica TaxID=2054316 RepID=UPI0025725EE8|nr:TatD family hydrolase [Thalassotalea atypica]
MIDIGVNLTNSRFEHDYPEVIARAQLAGLEQLIVTGTNVEESIAALELCALSPKFLSCTAGVHPHDADGVSEDYLFTLAELAKNESVKAIGECGLDFNRNFSTPKQQIKVFREQVALAERLNMPLFLHQRDAFEPWQEILSSVVGKVPALISHCFTGDVKQMHACLEMGMYLGITGWVCDERRGAELQTAVKELPLERLLVETDAPYLTPRNIRPKPKSSRNEPSYLPFVVQKIAALKNVSDTVIIEHSRENAKKVFSL